MHLLQRHARPNLNPMDGSCSHTCPAKSCVPAKQPLCLTHLGLGLGLVQAKVVDDGLGVLALSLGGHLGGSRCGVGASDRGEWEPQAAERGSMPRGKVAGHVVPLTGRWSGPGPAVLTQGPTTKRRREQASPVQPARRQEHASPLTKMILPLSSLEAPVSASNRSEPFLKASPGAVTMTCAARQMSEQTGEQRARQSGARLGGLST